MIWLLPPAFASELPYALDRVVDEALASGLPADPLAQKAYEGLAKGVPEERIERVMREELARWYGADQLLGERARGADRQELVPAAAAAIREGAPAIAIEALASGPEAPQALWTLSDVLYAGLPAPEAESLVRSALASRDPEVALRELPEATRLLVAVADADAATQMLTVALSSGQMPLAAVSAAPVGPGHGRGNGNNGQGWGKGGKPK